VLVSRLHAAAGALFPPKGEEEKSKVESRRHAANSVSTPATRHDLPMTRWWDSDKAIARGAAPGTRGGRPVRLQSRPATRDIATERPPPLDPPTGAVAVFRPRLSLFHPKQWIAVTDWGLEARDGDLVSALRRSEIQAIQVVRGGPVTFVGAGGRVLLGIGSSYTASQVKALAALLGVRVIRP
jgi:hypothetical protein